MDQLTQQLKSGEMQIRDVPMPVVAAGMVLVRNHFSLISAGTEGSTVKSARKSLLGKAKERPEQVRQVLETLKTQGPAQTFRAVMKKLDAYSPLGYSSAGEVLEVGPGVNGFTLGDKVACAGVGYANHAEIVSVPVNLCVKLPADADLKRAAYNTLGAIALQGVRQADLRLGESCAVIGLGLLGQLTCLLLRASGVRAFGIDVESGAVQTACENAADLAWLRSATGVAEELQTATGGLGVDAVIVTAGTSSLDPINFAGQISRKKGRVVVVGAVPTGFDRESYYQKELDLRMSCSYGPGRYDPAYEEKGIDYPASYVRWTENRNMKAFQDLVHAGSIDLDYLTTHEFNLGDASRAYDLIVNRTEPFLGIVLKYDAETPLERRPIAVRQPRPAAEVGIAFIGAGSYAQGNLLPHIPRSDAQVVCKGVMSRSGTTSRRVAERNGFEFCTSDPSDILDNQDVNAVFIATRHDSHADYVLKSLDAGKHVFVEKPLCLNLPELAEIEKAHRRKPEQHVVVGFNRRFSSLVRSLKERIGNGPCSMVYRINAGAIPAEHWIQDAEFGGGRIVGEACHFIDLLSFVCGSLPVRVFASALPDPQGLNDTVVINIEFSDGSVGNVSYFANGSKDLPKEYVEVHQSGVSAVIEDFRRLTVYSKRKPYRKRLFGQDKGQAAMVSSFILGIKEGGRALMDPSELFAVTACTFGVLESLRSRNPVMIQPSQCTFNENTTSTSGTPKVRGAA